MEYKKILVFEEYLSLITLERLLQQWHMYLDERKLFWSKKRFARSSGISKLQFVQLLDDATHPVGWRWLGKQTHALIQIMSSKCLFVYV